MAFEITYNKLLEVAIWQHAWLRAGTYDPAPHTYTGTTTSFVLPLNTAVPTSVLPRLLKYDLRTQINIQPSASTNEQLKQLGLTFKQTTTGFFIANRSSANLPSSPNLRLSFSVQLIDGAFIEETLIDSGWPQGQIFHLSNAQATPVSRYLLSQTSGIPEVLDPQHFYARQGRVVRLAQSVAGTAATVNVFDDLAAPADPAVKTFILPAISGQTEYELDCRSLTEGRYRFESTNINNTTLYLGLENMPGLLGVIDLFPIGWEGSFYDIRLAENTT